jgi:2-methylcitrate dehydratase PrpD
VLEGRFGYMNVFCHEGDPARLTAGLGDAWKMLTLTLKRYSCHITSHVPVTAALELQEKHKIKGDDIASITVEGSEKIHSHHNIPEPQDMTMAQYSTPFNVALSFYRNPRDPDSFSEESRNDAQIRALCRNVKVVVRKDPVKNNPLASRVTVKLKDGREFALDLPHFPGMPQQPLSNDQLREKFTTITAGVLGTRAEKVFADFSAIEKVADMRDII